jgi:hypothetical protein
LAESDPRKKADEFLPVEPLHWNKAGLNYLIISELSEAEMEKLEDLLREQAD